MPIFNTTITTASGLAIQIALQELLELRKLFVQLTSDGVPVGYAALRYTGGTKLASVIKVQILPEFQRRGVTTALLTYFKGAGYTILRTPTENLNEASAALSEKVRASNIVSQEFWK